jgi:hypothetical protein
LVHDSPTSVLFFDDSEAEQKDSLSSPDFTHPGKSQSKMAAMEVGGTPPPHDGFVPLLDHETGTVHFLDIITGERMDGAKLYHYSSKKFDDPEFENICADSGPVAIVVDAKASTKLSVKDHTQGSPTSLAFFEDSEAEQASSLSDFSSPVHSSLLEFLLPRLSTSHSAYAAMIILCPIFKTQISAFDISSVYLKESGSLYFEFVQGFPSYWISAAACGSDPPSPLIASTFFSYWFDGFVPFQCFCFCVIIFLSIWFYGFALNKAYFLDFLCSKAGLRNAKSVRPNLSNIQGDMDLRVSESKFSTGFFLSMTFVLGAAVDPLLPSSSFVWFDGFALIESYSLDLLCSTAGLRIAKSVRPNLSNIQGDIDQRVSESKFSAGPFPSMTFALGAAVDLILPSTSLLNSA